MPFLSDSEEQSNVNFLPEEQTPLEPVVSNVIPQEEEEQTQNQNGITNGDYTWINGRWYSQREIEQQKIQSLLSGDTNQRSAELTTQYLNSYQAKQFEYQKIADEINQKVIEDKTLDAIGGNFPDASDALKEFPIGAMNISRAMAGWTMKKLYQVSPEFGKAGIRSLSSGVDKLLGGAQQLIGSAMDIGLNSLGHNEKSYYSEMGEQLSKNAEFLDMVSRPYNKDITSVRDVHGFGDAAAFVTNTLVHETPILVASVFSGGGAGVAIKGAQGAALSAGTVANMTRIGSIGNRIVHGLPMAGIMGTKAFGQRKIQAERMGYDSNTAAIKSLVASLPDAAFGFMPSVFTKLDPSALRMLGETATAGGINVLFLPLSLSVDERMGLSKLQNNETYMEYLTRGVKEGWMDAAAFGAIFHMISLPGRKFGEHVDAHRALRDANETPNRPNEPPESPILQPDEVVNPESTIAGERSELIYDFARDTGERVKPDMESFITEMRSKFPDITDVEIADAFDYALESHYANIDRNQTRTDEPQNPPIEEPVFNEEAPIEQSSEELFDTNRSASEDTASNEYYDINRGESQEEAGPNRPLNVPENEEPVNPQGVTARFNAGEETNSKPQNRPVASTFQANESSTRLPIPKQKIITGFGREENPIRTIPASLSSVEGGRAVWQELQNRLDGILYLPAKSQKGRSENAKSALMVRTDSQIKLLQELNDQTAKNLRASNKMPEGAIKEALSGIQNEIAGLKKQRQYLISESKGNIELQSSLFGEPFDVENVFADILSKMGSDSKDIDMLIKLFEGNETISKYITEDKPGNIINNLQQNLEALNKEMVNRKKISDKLIAEIKEISNNIENNNITDAKISELKSLKQELTKDFDYPNDITKFKTALDTASHMKALLNTIFQLSQKRYAYAEETLSTLYPEMSEAQIQDLIPSQYKQDKQKFLFDFVTETKNRLKIGSENVEVLSEKGDAQRKFWDDVTFGNRDTQEVLSNYNALHEEIAKVYRPEFETILTAFENHRKQTPKLLDASKFEVHSNGSDNLKKFLPDAVMKEYTDAQLWEPEVTEALNKANIRSAGYKGRFTNNIPKNENTPTMSGKTYNKLSSERLVRKNYYASKNSDVLIAADSIDNGKTSTDTSYAINMAIDMHKPVYLFDTKTLSWKFFDGHEFVNIDTGQSPMLSERVGIVSSRNVTKGTDGHKAITEYLQRQSGKRISNSSHTQEYLSYTQFKMKHGALTKDQSKNNNGPYSDIKDFNAYKKYSQYKYDFINKADGNKFETLFPDIYTQTKFKEGVYRGDGAEERNQLINKLSEKEITNLIGPFLSEHGQLPKKKNVVRKLIPYTEEMAKKDFPGATKEQWMHKTKTKRTLTYGDNVLIDAFRNFKKNNKNENISRQIAKIEDEILLIKNDKEASVRTHFKSSKQARHEHGARLESLLRTGRGLRDYTSDSSTGNVRLPDHFMLDGNVQDNAPTTNESLFSTRMNTEAREVIEQINDTFLKEVVVTNKNGLTKKYIEKDFDAILSLPASEQNKNLYQASNFNIDSGRARAFRFTLKDKEGNLREVGPLFYSMGKDSLTNELQIALVPGANANIQSDYLNMFYNAAQLSYEIDAVRANATTSKDVGRDMKRLELRNARINLRLEAIIDVTNNRAVVPKYFSDLMNRNIKEMLSIEDTYGLNKADKTKPVEFDAVVKDKQNKYKENETKKSTSNLENLKKANKIFQETTPDIEVLNIGLDYLDNLNNLYTTLKESNPELINSSKMYAKAEQDLFAIRTMFLNASSGVNEPVKVSSRLNFGDAGKSDTLKNKNIIKYLIESKKIFEDLLNPLMPETDSWTKSVNIDEAVEQLSLDDNNLNVHTDEYFDAMIKDIEQASAAFIDKNLTYRDMQKERLISDEQAQRDDGETGLVATEEFERFVYDMGRTTEESDTDGTTVKGRSNSKPKPEYDYFKPVTDVIEHYVEIYRQQSVKLDAFTKALSDTLQLRETLSPLQIEEFFANSLTNHAGVKFLRDSNNVSIGNAEYSNFLPGPIREKIGNVNSVTSGQLSAMGIKTARTSLKFGEKGDLFTFGDGNFYQIKSVSPFEFNDTKTQTWMSMNAIDANLLPPEMIQQFKKDNLVNTVYQKIDAGKVSEELINSARATQMYHLKEGLRMNLAGLRRNREAGEKLIEQLDTESASIGKPESASQVPFSATEETYNVNRTPSDFENNPTGVRPPEEGRVTGRQVASQSNNEMPENNQVNRQSMQSEEGVAGEQQIVKPKRPIGFRTDEEMQQTNTSPVDEITMPQTVSSEMTDSSSEMTDLYGDENSRYNPGVWEDASQSRIAPDENANPKDVANNEDAINQSNMPPDEQEVINGMNPDFLERMNRREENRRTGGAEEGKMNWKDKFIKYVVDKGGQLHKWVSSVEKIMGKPLPEGANPQTQFMLLKARTNHLLREVKAELKATVYMQFDKTVEMGKKYNLTPKEINLLVDEYSQLKQTPVYNEIVMERNQYKELPKRFLSTGRSIELLNQIKNTYPELYPQLQIMHENITAQNNKSAMRLGKAGIWDISAVNKMIARGPDYAPMYLDSTSADRFAQLRQSSYFREGVGAYSNQGLKSRTGSAGLKSNVIFHTVQQIEARTRMIPKSQVGRALLDFVHITNRLELSDAKNIEKLNSLKDIVMVVDPDKLFNNADVEAYTMDMVKDFGVESGDIDIFHDEFTKMRDMVHNYTRKDNGLVQTRIDKKMFGENILPVSFMDATTDKLKTMYLVFNNKREDAMDIARLLNGNTEDRAPSNPLTRGYSNVMTLYNRLNVGDNPFFAVTNFLSDTSDFLINAQSTPLKGHVTETLKSIPEVSKVIVRYEKALSERASSNNLDAFNDLINSDANLKLLHELSSEGGLHTYMESNYPSMDSFYEDLMKGATAAEKNSEPMQQVKKTLSGLHDVLRRGMSVSENAIRFATYKKLIELGHTKTEAAVHAKEITANFDRKGVFAIQMNRLFSFTTATIAGQSRMYRTLTSKTGSAILGGALLAGFLQNKVYRDMDPLEAGAVPEWAKKDHLIIPAGDGTYIKLKIRGIAPVFNLGRYIEGATQGDSSLVDSALATLASIMPTGQPGSGLQAFVPTLMKPFAAIYENVGWTGRKISVRDPKGLVPNWLNTKPSASELGNEIATALGTLTSNHGQPGLFNLSGTDIDYLTKTTIGSGVTSKVIKTFKNIGDVLKGDDEITENPILQLAPVIKSNQKMGMANMFYEINNNFQQVRAIHNRAIQSNNLQGANDIEKNNPYGVLINSPWESYSLNVSRIMQDKKKYFNTQVSNGNEKSDEVKNRLKLYDTMVNQEIDKSLRYIKSRYPDFLGATK